MIDKTLRGKIKGLDELFKIVGEDYNFHDAELEHMEWDIDKRELTVTYGIWDIDGSNLHFVTWHLIPEMNDFDISISPHNPYTGGIDITNSESQMSKYKFEADCDGPIMDCEDIWVEIKEGDPKTFLKISCLYR